MSFRSEPSWLLLVISLPTPSAAARMRVWRALKALGCMALRDGAYLLPADKTREDALLGIARDCIHEGGAAWLVGAQPHSTENEQAWRGLFDRSNDYADLRMAWKDASRSLAALGPAELARLQRKLRRDFEAVRAIDFFPSDASVEAEVALDELAKRIQSVLSPDEPKEIDARIPRLLKERYLGKIWATRRKLWIDRVASAWLILRFIDPQATFVWLSQPAELPKGVLGFDFDGAAFTHVGDRVTFETLMASFDLEEDPALVRLAALVHHLDVGGEPVPEAAGFEAVMTGARARLDDDDALLSEMSSMLDSLYVHFQRAPVRAGL
ncbi:chromate resistance protein ChrB domain-containing protein [Thiomonas sp. FB-6]|jgi:hypothetical protein|uniref:chromate resistance protein ChrB domain-containing protein n=1 Tax=Thiomonas sp. FB-6 TaxID=1158291 RepID=UPI0004764757|nr:chromate resistance protein ChrB domain-containing protein [Thiomonas sp. FB-6]